MSPRVHLRCHPEDDGAFASVSGTTLDIHVSDATPDLAAAVLGELRRTHPNALIRIEDRHDRAVEVWHVYRDGLPA